MDYGTSVVGGSTDVETDCSPVGQRPDGRGRRSVYQETEEEEERIPSVGSNNEPQPYKLFFFTITYSTMSYRFNVKMSF